MSKRAKYVPKHRHVPEPSARRALPAAVRNGLVTTSVAAAVTGIAIAGGSLQADPVAPLAQEVSGPTGDETAQKAPAPEREAQAQAQAQEQEQVESRLAASADRSTLSRSEVRRTASAASSKAGLLSAQSGPARTASVDLSQSDPRDIARALMPRFGFGADQFGCLDSLWIRESNWNPAAHNPSSGAHGIPQSLPGSKMASAGPDWESNPVTQITWGLGYIQDRYGSPCGAWAHSESHGWY